MDRAHDIIPITNNPMSNIFRYRLNIGVDRLIPLIVVRQPLKDIDDKAQPHNRYHDLAQMAKDALDIIRSQFSQRKLSFCKGQITVQFGMEIRDSPNRITNGLRFRAIHLALLANLLPGVVVSLGSAKHVILLQSLKICSMCTQRRLKTTDIPSHLLEDGCARSHRKYEQ